jgi:hypothetical protein
MEGGNWTIAFGINAADCSPMGWLLNLSSIHVRLSWLRVLPIMAGFPFVGYQIFVFSFLIGLRALYTKAHYFGELPLAAFLG